ncbi:hypothetical protein QEH52_10055 [Coraliomargarita sp. SDUM461003]|uniref:Uncharacterized protein n=1 Tax=Thalassobacterium maritimum TaxID=3041265 RepID=A0ABU1AUM4_9BACT|nr:hypothetical protein [Coraliomargarita sp. SDUM461003]MDQ8207854.1 hypothetical protein [Coraliomargarita sp. SDUM461003]
MKRYFKLCLWSPIWFPVVLGLIAYALESLTGDLYDTLPEWTVVIGFVVVLSVLYGGVQYLITIVFLWGRINFDDARSWVKYILMLPLIFTLVQVITMFVLIGWTAQRLNDLSWIGALALFDLVLGYAYVAVWLLGFMVIRAYQSFVTQEARYE